MRKSVLILRYTIYTSFTRFSALNIDNIGISDDMNITRFGPGQRTSYIIFYVTNGKGYFNGHLIKKGQGFIRGELSKRLRIKRSPEFAFVKDEGAAYAQKINEILRDINKDDN